MKQEDQMSKDLQSDSDWLSSLDKGLLIALVILAVLFAYGV